MCLAWITSKIRHSTLFSSAFIEDFTVKVFTKVHLLYIMFLDEIFANYRIFIFLYTLMKVTARVSYIIPPHYTNHIEIYIQHSGYSQGALFILSHVSSQRSSKQEFKTI